MSDILRAAGSDDLDGLALSRFISQLGVELHAPCLFVGEADPGKQEAEWRRWLQLRFAPLLGPALAETYSQARERRLEEIEAQDRRLDEALDEAERTRSLAAAPAFLGGKAAMQANSEWRRYAQAVASGRCPGHAPILFTLQCALYHLPLASTLGAYLWFELEAGWPRSAGFRDREGGKEEALALFAMALPQVKLAMQAQRGDFNQDAPQLRAI